MTTSCAECMFSIKTDDLQIGCAAGRLAKFYKLGKAYIDKETPDHHTIDALCNLCFHSENPVNVLEALKVAKRRIVPKIHCFVKIYNNTKLCDVEQTVHSLTRQIVKPSISLICEQDYPLYKLQSYLLQDKNLNINQLYHSNYNEEIRRLAKLSDSQFMSIIDAGKTYSNLLYAKLHGRLNVQLKQIVLVKTPLIINTKLYNFLSTDKALTRGEIISLVEDKAKDSSENNMIWEKL